MITYYIIFIIVVIKHSGSRLFIVDFHSVFFLTNFILQCTCLNLIFIIILMVILAYEIFELTPYSRSSAIGIVSSCVHIVLSVSILLSSTYLFWYFDNRFFFTFIASNSQTVLYFISINFQVMIRMKKIVKNSQEGGSWCVLCKSISIFLNIIPLHLMIFYWH
jgi:hypothetical protein